MDWITDRLPTKADGDEWGDVVIAIEDGWDMARWEEVPLGTPWLAFKPATTTKRRIISTNRTVQESGDHTIDAVANDGTAWWMIAGVTDGWTQLPALPDRG